MHRLPFLRVACKSNKALSAGPKLCQIVAIGPKFVGACPAPLHIYALFHCENPWCVAACPPGPCKGGPRTDCVCGAESLRGLQDLHVRLPVGGSTVEPGDRQGGEMRLLLERLMPA